VVPLVKAVQELSEQNDTKDAAIVSLQAQVNELAKLVYLLLEKENASNTLRSAGGSESVIELSDSPAFLEQNIPNPFNQTTVVRYTLPQICSSAQLIITSAFGKVIRQIPLSVSNRTDSITIEGNTLSAGIYFYTLVCDGKPVDTKQMVLTR
jgi:hypothetical protein